MKILKIIVLAFCTFSLFACKPLKRKTFDDSYLTSANWIIEQQQGGKVEFKNKIIEIIDAKGCTIWFKHILTGPIQIEYDVTVIGNKGPYDRVSDLNCFWMASDPKNPNDFFKDSKNRKGFFPNYHELKQYYVGYGGHDNSKSRFRRYDENKERPLLAEHDLSDKKFMIVPNKKIHVTLIANKNKIQYLRDGEVIFNLNDEMPYTKGYFGIRTVENHMIVENLKISTIK
ncbi:DUF6250 domain-containing protein [Flavobacterium sp. PL12]|uniref:DUF6250 domain-containing protein n=1 Tax=Flavobacterium sp. PL12 TaxID=3071718 RepID=UPI00319D8CF3